MPFVIPVAAWYTAHTWAPANMPACVDNSTYTFPCPANYTNYCPANGWHCADWQGWSCGEGSEAAAFHEKYGADTPAANIAALLRECQSSCNACRNAKYELVKEKAECKTDDTQLFNNTQGAGQLFNNSQACANECAAHTDCEGFDFGRDDAGSINPAFADRKGMCWFEHTLSARCPEVHSMQP